MEGDTKTEPTQTSFRQLLNDVWLYHVALRNLNAQKRGKKVNALLPTLT
jgi:hypothetical protein